jgi:predicted methyltransferase
MARITEARAAAPLPPVGSSLLASLEELLSDRPEELVEHAQLHIDPESCLRRALAIRERLDDGGPVLAVGDDDGVTVALALLGVGSLYAIDIDPRVLAFVSERARRAGGTVETAVVDVFEDPLPRELRHACEAVITDPPRSIEEAAPFIALGAAALRRDGPAWLFACDHPDWSFRDAVVELIGDAGLELVETRENLHAYPLDPSAFPLLDAAAPLLGRDETEARALVERTRAWSHLHVAVRR